MQLAPYAWGDTSYGYFASWFACNGPQSHHWFCDPRIDRTNTRALTLSDTDPRTAASLWTALGARPRSIAPTLHDALVALTSHLPYAASVSLVRTLRRTGSMTRELAEVAGPGLRDTTRIAGSSASLWAEILSLNGPKLIPALELLEREVRALRHAIAEGGPALQAHLEEARAFREELSR